MAFPPLELKLRKDQVKKAKEMYAKVQRRIKSGSPYYNKAAILMHRNVIKHFRDGEGPNGKWQKLKEPRRRGGNKILIDTGTLRSSLLFQGQPRNAIVRTSIKYARAHNEGTSNIPQREFMWLDGALRSRLITGYGKWIADGKL